MLIPSSISPNVLKVYTPKNYITGKNNKCESYNFTDFNQSVPTSLRELCLLCIGKNWEGSPVLNEILKAMDKHLLLDILAAYLPLSLTVPLIKENIYWKRAFLEKWKNKIPFNVSEIEPVKIVQYSTTKTICSKIETNVIKEKKNNNLIETTWRECFLEMYIKEYLEKVVPERYDPEEVKDLSDLCADYIKKLNLEELKCSNTTCQRMALNPILTGFQNLKELSICFKEKYVDGKFSWNIVRTTENEMKLLANGLESCRLSVLRILNSDIDCNKVKIILKALQKHDSLSTLDFSNCKIKDQGALEIAKLCMQISIKELILTNNQIGSFGAKTIAYALAQQSCRLNKLDLGLNEISNDGVSFIMQTLAIKDVFLKSLVVSSCGITEHINLEDLIKFNEKLQILDISNNNIGEETGILILESLNFNISIKSMDTRMCQFSSETELKIYNKIKTNKKLKKSKHEATRCTNFVNIYDKEFIIMENIFMQNTQ